MQQGIEVTDLSQTQCDHRQSNIGLTNLYGLTKMQKSLPTQAETFRWMSVFLAGKLNQAAQNEDWARVMAISTIIKATLECLSEIDV